MKSPEDSQVKETSAGDGDAAISSAPPRAATTVACGAPGSVSGVPTAAAPRPPFEKMGNYRLKTLLGRGGMGEVWLAEHTGNARLKCAIKVIRADQTLPGLLDRFEREREALAELRHEHIVKINDLGVTDEGVPYLLMEYVDGHPLDLYCDEHRLPLTERLQLFLRICRAVAHAHRLGMIHRDLKPANILVTASQESGDRTPIPKVIDFGVSRVLGMHERLGDRPPKADASLDLALTQTGMFVGSLLYASPEQLLGRPVDTRTDVYSLGKVLYLLLSGTLPVTGQDMRSMASSSPIDLCQRLATTRPESPSAKLSKHAGTDHMQLWAAARDLSPAKLPGALRPELDWIVLKAIENNAEARYSSVEQFAQDIQCYLNDDVVSAHPSSVPYRLGKYCRRHRWGLAAAALLVAVLLAGLITSMTFERQARLQAARAEHEAANASDQMKAAKEQEQLAQQRLKAEEAARARATEQEGLANDRLKAEKAASAKAAEQEKLAQDRLQAEQKARKEADEQTALADELVLDASRADHVSAEDEFHAQRWNNGIAYLGRALKTAPHNKIAISHLWSAIVARTDREKILPYWISPTAETVVDHGFSADAQQLFLRLKTGKLKVFTVPGLQEIYSLGDDAASVVDATFTAQSHHLISLLSDGTLLQSSTTGTEVTHDKIGVIVGAKSLVDGCNLAQQIGVLNEQGNVVLVDVTSRSTRELEMNLQGMIVSAAINPLGTHLLVHTSEEDTHTDRIFVVPVDDPKKAAVLPETDWKNNNVKSVSFSPEGNKVAVHSADTAKTDKVTIWDVDLHRIHTKFATAFVDTSHGGEPVAPVWSPDAERIAVIGNSLDEAFLYTTEAEVSGTFFSLDDDITALAFDPYGSRCLSGSWDGGVGIFSTDTGKPVGKTMWHDSQPKQLALSGNSKWLAVRTESGRFYLWSLQSEFGVLKNDEAVKPAQLPATPGKSSQRGRHQQTPVSPTPAPPSVHATSPTASASKSAEINNEPNVSPNGRWHLQPDGGNTALVIRTEEETPSGVILRLESPLRAYFWSPDGERVTTLTEQNYVRLWSIVDGLPITAPRRLSAPVKEVQVEADLLTIIAQDGSHGVLEIIDPGPTPDWIVTFTDAVTGVTSSQFRRLTPLSKEAQADQREMVAAYLEDVRGSMRLWLRLVRWWLDSTEPSTPSAAQQALPKPRRGVLKHGALLETAPLRKQ